MVLDTITGFDGFYIQPMREPKVKRYTVNQVPIDMNASRPIAKCIDDKINLLDYKIVEDVIGLKIDFLDWRDFDWVDMLCSATHPKTKHTVYAFVAYRGEEKSVLKCVKVGG